MRAFVGLFAAALILPKLVVAEPPLLIVLAETGREQEGLPVYEVHSDAEGLAATLSEGFSGRFVRLYQMHQQFLARQEARDPEPAYLLLSKNQGGFPRFGFVLSEQRKRDAGYVDLHERLPEAGRFGAMDQIFPHELAHVIVQQLAGQPVAQHFTQIHAIGVTTDPVTAFQEGFAEHLQVLAVDDPDADPRTRHIALEGEILERTQRRFRAYRREISARWSPATRMRMTFPLWFSGADQVMRYHAVKANLFAQEPPIPFQLIEQRRFYSAYLLGNVLPGAPGSEPRSPQRMLACEGVVASLFHAWATSAALGARYEDGDFYTQFGASPDDVDALDNVYLKIFFALYRHKPRHTADLIRGYRETFPADVAALDEVVERTLLGQGLALAEPIWIANPEFKVGTSLFDQFRRAPRGHVFDLNAASLVDLMALPGMDESSARTLLAHAPYARFDQLHGIAALEPALISRLHDMRLGEPQTSQGDAEGQVTRDLKRILFSYLWRALAAWAIAALGGTLLYRRLQRSSWLRAAIMALALSVLGLAAAWLLEATGGSMAIVVPVLVVGTPAALWRGVRARSLPEAGRTLVACAASCIPAALLSQPLL